MNKIDKFFDWVLNKILGPVSHHGLMKCRECFAPADYKVRFRPQYVSFYVCSSCLSEESKTDGSTIIPLS